ncbi:cadherin repeat domain-containing protein [Microvirga brassicacearum]|uniref:Cadherin repeat domain-containing protein n=1 Tax=Microvirga brassicacearum TaxID=2580413 RepID=A0A5N3PH86_9HYPH|nr:cadherin repeat domain-containing protein [Microvirga brassicacearum]KAB0269079.1 cadherin repeat domain-containing protein [Microvirga brassicacearum]
MILSPIRPGASAKASAWLNRPPTGIALSAASISESAAEGTSVGTLSFTDPDFGATGAFTLLNDAGGRFKIVGTALQAGSVPTDFEAAESHNITVRFTDQGGLTFDKTFAIAVLDVLEPEAETTALLARFDVQPDATRQGHINTLMKGLKEDGVYARGYRLFIEAAHTEQAARQNWLADTADLVNVGTPTFTADRGFQFPGGSLTALDTGFNPATAIGVPALDNISIAGWITGQTGAGCIIGHTNLRIQTQSADGDPITRCNDATTSAPNHTFDCRSEYVCISRAAAANYQSRVGTEEVTTAVASSAVGANIELGRIGTTNTSGIIAMHHFAWIGQSLTKAQSDALRSRVRTYLLAVGVTLTPEIEVPPPNPIEGTLLATLSAAMEDATTGAMLGAWPSRYGSIQYSEGHPTNNPGNLVQRSTDTPPAGSTALLRCYAQPSGSVISKAGLTRQLSGLTIQPGDVTLTTIKLRIPGANSLAELYWWDAENTANGSVGMRIKWGSNQMPRIDREFGSPRARSDDQNRTSPTVPAFPRGPFVILQAEVGYSRADDANGFVIVRQDGVEVCKILNCRTMPTSGNYNQIQNGITATQVEHTMDIDNVVWEFYRK